MRGEQDPHEQGHSHAHGPSAGLREERRPPQPDAVEVAPGVLRLQLEISLPGLGHVNCYAMTDEKGITLVDPGLPGPTALRDLTRRLRRADLPIERVHTVVVTHSHPDHFGQAGVLRERHGARVITHRNFRTWFDPDEEPEEISTDDIGAEPIATNARVATSEESAGRGGGGRGPWSGNMPWGTTTSADHAASRGRRRGGGPGRPPLRRRLQYMLMKRSGGLLGMVPRPTDRVEDADHLELGGRRWVAMHTPGHTNDHLCLFDPDAGVLISGDHVLPTITPHISGTGVIVDPLAEFFRSLERVGELDGVRTVLPAHGLEFHDLAGRAEAITRHHQERLQLLRDASADLGWATVPQYSTYLFQERSYGQMADSETYAHLEHLRLTGEAEVRDDGPELLYKVG
ncbi:MBL fold metallo-hydrolase [Actinomarinicola tropica]|uniref:MBL fold metallo-hydrolase n=1 Tax=Actinomarinicola tropica TaxID=2789776 RepID=A0A5Q2RHD3_9ACTN|nr:MBL fold metallo-hydrolase [Actinomarinicola tropica]QGG93726.1 MBL fold metallo-hydrolase [Actinomarinicola tropica]